MNEARPYIEVLREELWEVYRLREKRHKVPNDAPTCSEPQFDADNNTSNPETPKHVFDAAEGMQTAGICLSGGGIRSATFNLGVLQGLAEAGLLPVFDYLSTVSGGGYIGSWLVAWIRRRGLANAQDGLKPERSTQVGQDHSKERPEIRFLRDYSNYLTPRLGLLGADTWTGIAIYLRNVLLNQTILILFLSCALLLPHLLAYLAKEHRAWFMDAADAGIVIGHSWALWLAAALGAVSVFFTAWNMGYFNLWPASEDEVMTRLPEDVHDLNIYLQQQHAPQDAANLWKTRLRNEDRIEIWDPTFTNRLGPLTGELSIRVNKDIAPGGQGRIALTNPPGAAEEPFPAGSFVVRRRHYPRFTQSGWVWATVVLPFLGVAWLLAMWLWANPGTTASTPGWATDWAMYGALGYVGMWVAGHLVSSAFEPRTENREVLKQKAARWAGYLLSIAVSGAVAGILVHSAGSVLVRTLASGNFMDTNYAITMWGLPVVTGALLLVGVMHIGLLGILLPDERREWWSRAGGLLLVCGIQWMAISGVAMYGPYWVVRLGVWVKMVGVAWIATTLGGVFGAKSGQSGLPGQKNWLDSLLAVTPYVFIIGLMVALSFGLEGLLAWVASKAGGGDASARFLAFLHSGANELALLPGRYQMVLSGALGWWLPWVFLGCMAVMLAMAWRVDINEFSMHLLYRNRLARAYLGASHREREPNPFTGFDAQDDLYLKSIRAEHGYEGPYPLLNTALNLVHGQSLAWQERKAESFTLSPINCGFDVWLEQRDPAFVMAPGEQPLYGYRRTEEFTYRDGGLFLGTALSISGAAASPNMGYYSKPALAFLMTMFDVRLGFWTGNPRNARTWRQAGPIIGLFRLVAELAGITDDTAPYVYLSDGGHFENLGLYELIKRRCHLIVVCDGSADPNYTFEDLANAIRKVRVDLGIEIEVNVENLKAVEPGGVSRWHCVAGEIKYGAEHQGSPSGTLLYLKASLTGSETTDVQNFKKAHPEFPHESTEDQWFSESQFESYRALGLDVARSLLAPLPNRGAGLSAGDLAEAILARWHG